MIIEACAAIIQRRSRVLVTQRKSGQRFPLKWELPGGHIEPNESKKACLRREIKEELGVHITALKPFCKRKTRVGKDTILVHFYGCRISHGKLRRLDVQDFRWIQPSQYALYDFVPPDRSVLRRLSKLASGALRPLKSNQPQKGKVTYPN